MLLSESSCKGVGGDRAGYLWVIATIRPITTPVSAGVVIVSHHGWTRGGSIENRCTGQPAQIRVFRVL